MADQKPERTRLRDLPLKPIAQNMAVVGGMTLAGHTLGGAAGHLLAQKGPLKARLQAMPPDERSKLFRRGGALLGGAIVPATMGAQHLASQVHLYHAMRKWEKAQDKKQQGEKTASVILVYGTALKGLL